MENRVIGGIIVVMALTSIVVSLGTGVFSSVLWVLTQYIGESVAIGLLWHLFPNKIIRTLLLTVGAYYLTDLCMHAMFYISPSMYAYINNGYSYALTILVGVVGLITNLTNTV